MMPDSLTKMVENAAILQHPTVTVFLVTDTYPREVLLLQHRKLGKWLPPGGHQENDENPYQTAIREVKEETGIDITPHFPAPKRLDARARSLPVPRFFLEVDIAANGSEPAHRHMDMIYVVEIHRQSFAHNPAESLAIQWFREDQLDEIDTFDNIKGLLRLIFSSEKTLCTEPPALGTPALCLL